MSQDGADLGISADTALHGVLGGEHPPQVARRTPNEMRTYLETTRGFRDYGSCAAYAGHFVLAFLDAHPELHTAPADTVYDYDSTAADWDTKWRTRTVRIEGLYEAIERLEPATFAKLRALGLTGFMWGWAVNAARYALDLPPVPNPAIVRPGEPA